MICTIKFGNSVKCQFNYIVLFRYKLRCGSVSMDQFGEGLVTLK